MSRQILFCVESNNKARTDYQYIEETLKRFYKVDRKIRYRAIYLGSKTKYNAKDKVREINKNIKHNPKTVITRLRLNAGSLCRMWDSIISLPSPMYMSEIFPLPSQYGLSISKVTV